VPIQSNRWARLVLAAPLLLASPGFANEPARSFGTAPIVLAQQSGGARPAAPAPAAFSEAIRVLARERSAAEAYAILLDTHGKKDVSRYVRGIELYADAKAEFDGLIEGLKAEVGAGRDPAASPQFKELLDAAAKKRIAFTSFVGEDVIGNTQGAKPALPVVIAAVPALVKALVDAGVAIWKEWVAVSTERRKEIVDQLNGLRWRAFADIAT